MIFYCTFAPENKIVKNNRKDMKRSIFYMDRMKENRVQAKRKLRKNSLILLLFLSVFINTKLHGQIQIELS
jgi:hypothetical protein